jgi:hypothetical protein
MNETDYRKCISDSIDWCEAHNLILNINKTKEMIFDYRKGVTVNKRNPLYMNGTDVEIVQKFFCPKKSTIFSFDWKTNLSVTY